MFENWVWEPRFLARLGRHYRTGEPLPTALVQNLSRSRIANAGVNTLRLVALAMLDLQLHHDIALNYSYVFLIVSNQNTLKQLKAQLIHTYSSNIGVRKKSMLILDAYVPKILPK